MKTTSISFHVGDLYIRIEVTGKPIKAKPKRKAQTKSR